MRTGNMKNTFNWILIFGLILFTVLLDKAGPVLFPSVTMVKYASLVVLVGTLPILIFTLNKIKRTNEELRKSKLKLKNIFDTLDVAIWSHDLKTNTLLITPGIEKLYGYTLNDFYEDLTLWKKVIYPEDFQIIDDREWRIALGEAVTSEYRIIRQTEKSAGFGTEVFQLLIIKGI
ncbi:PAS domain-containing protein [Neobacillus pocheonensis]|uniref:PAS domain-containing protein n=1 Tax=Neobacillus pocheonensis TaxID=363869 RepID=A0ABT0WEP2_9BACI|nr:PAS domain-containing protein [Neobacillus pocheonensis]